MSKTDAAIARLDEAMIRLDRAIGESQAKGAGSRHLLEEELAALREAYAHLETEARQVSDRLDDIIGRLAVVTGETGAAAPAEGA